MKSQGFTLIEMMVVVVIIAILATLAQPALDTWITNAKIRSAAETFQNGLRKAQQLAAMRNGTVRFKLVDAIAEQSRSQCYQIRNAADTKLAQYYAICAEGDELRGNEGNKNTTGNLPLYQSLRAQDDTTVEVVVSQKTAPSFFNNKYVEFKSTGGSSANSVEVFRFESTGKSSTGNNRHNCTDAANPGEIRCLQVVLSPGGRVRLCDPTYDNQTGEASMNPMACNYSQ